MSFEEFEKKYFQGEAPQAPGAELSFEEYEKKHLAPKRKLWEVQPSDFTSAFKNAGQDLLRGYQFGAAGMYELGANSLMLINRSADYLAETFGSDQKSKETILGKAEDYIRGLGKQVLTDARKTKGKTAATPFYEALGQLPVAAAEYAAGVRALGPVMGFATVDALKELEKGALEAAKAGYQGATLGRVAQAVAPMTRASRGVAMGAMGGAQGAVADEATRESALNQGLIMGGVGAALGGRGAGQRLFQPLAQDVRATAQRGVERLEQRQFDKAMRNMEQGQAIDPRLEQLMRREFLPEVSGRPMARDRTVAEKMLDDIDAGRPQKPLKTKPGEPERAGNLNMHMYYQGNQGYRAMREVSRYYPTEMELARFRTQEFADRGGVPWNASIEMAKALGMDHDLWTKRMMRFRRGEAVNSEEMLASVYAMRKAQAELSGKINNAIGGSDAQIADFVSSFTRYRLLQSQMTGMTAEAGRTLNILNAAKKTASDPTIENMSRMLEGMGGRDGIQKVAAMLREMDSPEQLARFTNQISGAKLGDKILMAWYNTILSGPQTHMVNLLSSGMFSANLIAERAAAAGIGAARSGVSRLMGKGPVTDRVYGREVSAGMMNLGENLRSAMEIGRRAYRTGELADPTTKIEAKHPDAAFGSDSANAMARMLGNVSMIPSRALGAEDEFVKAVMRRWETQALSMRKAISESKQAGHSKEYAKEFIPQRYQQLLADPPKDIMNQATEFGRRATFTNHLGATKFLQRFVNELPALKVILPFIRTPVNLQKEALQRTPLVNFLSSEVRDNLRAGGARMDKELSKMVVGGTLFGGVIKLAMEGKITGAGSGDRETRAIERMVEQPYSLQFQTENGPLQVALNRFDPTLGIQVGIAADIPQIWEEMNKEDRSNVLNLLAISFSNNLVSKTYLKGLSDMMLSLTDPARYGERFVYNTLASPVPTAAAQVARTIDPAAYEANSIVDKYRIKLGLTGPIESMGLGQVQPMRDRFGQPIVADQIQLGEPQEGGMGTVQKAGEFFVNLLNPAWIKKGQPDPVAQMLLDTDQIISKPNKTLMDVELTDEQHNRLQELQGQYIYNALLPFASNPGFRELPKFAQQKVIQDVKEPMAEMARSRLVYQEYPEVFKKRIEALQQMMSR